jgi:hypothetical protein
MPKCPNCGRETLRTEDWACQWCGYPLLSSSYEMIPKTYRQLKEERLHKPEPVPEQKLEQEPEPTFEPEAEPVLESQREPIPEAEQEVEPTQKHKPEPEPVVMELTVDELLSAYATDEVAADAKFVNKLLRVTGVVAMIDVKAMLDTHYIRLTGAERNLLQSVQCMFDKKHAPILKQLEKGQTVTVQGEYNGSLIAIRMIDCSLVQ